MKNLWSFLPGLRLYVQKVVCDIREGKNVILCLPEYAPYGLKQAIRDELEKLQILEWMTFHLPEDGPTPLETHLYHHFVDAPPGVRKCTLADIYEDDGFLGRFLWVEGMDADRWPRWKNFLGAYEHVCRTKQNCRQSLFCIVLEGDLAISPPTDELCLVSHRFSGAINGTDILIYASILTAHMPYSAMQRQVAASTLANVALWDIEICERLADERLETICEPVGCLRDLARERGWSFSSDESCAGLTWQSGMKDEFNGKPCVNSAVISCFKDTDKLAKRVWSAQAGLLLPFIEEKRSDLLPSIKRHIALPITTQFGVITDLCELEIGQIERQIRNKAEVHYKIKQELSILKDMRNALAHLEPISPKLLLTSSIFSD